MIFIDSSMMEREPAVLPGKIKPQFYPPAWFECFKALSSDRTLISDPSLCMTKVYEVEGGGEGPWLFRVEDLKFAILGNRRGLNWNQICANDPC